MSKKSKPSKAEAAKRIKKLRELINEYRYKYHVHNQSIMSEEAADSLKHELAKLEEMYPDLITPDSPTQRVAGEVAEGFESVQHKWPMLSLNDVFSREELKEWYERIKKLNPSAFNKGLFADLKMDGLACALVYEDGILVRGVTRGDGYVGEDVTQNIRTIPSIPLKLKNHIFSKGYTEVRGEIVMYKADFEQINLERERAGLPLFKNPRNLAAGTIRQLDPTLVSKRPLNFHAYDLLRENSSEVPTFDFAYQALRELGLKANKEASKMENLDEVYDYIEHWREKRDSLPFGTDGVVVKVNDRIAYEKLGVVGKAPRGAVAFKYPSEEATTKVKDIVISIGRTGAATPVAILEPVELAGTTVQRASLHNEDEIKRKDIRVGDTVIIHKAGDIIPQVVKPLTKLRSGEEKQFNMRAELKKLPFKFVKPEGEAVWRAVDINNPQTLKRSIEHFASRNALDIPGLGSKVADLLVESGLVKDLADLYSLSPEDLVGLEGFAELSAKKLVDAIQSKKHPQLERFIYGLGIRHVGMQTAIDLAKKFKTLESLIETATNDPEKLYEIEGIGDVVAHSIAEWFSSERNQELLAKFKRLGVWPKKAETTRGPLSGVSFAITGTLKSMSRDEAAEKIRKLGGSFQGSVSKNTDYLVYGEKAGKSKTQKAKEFGVKVIGEQEFLKLLGEI